jgi:uncharacterized membrane protein
MRVLKGTDYSYLNNKSKFYRKWGIISSLIMILVIIPFLVTGYQLLIALAFIPLAVAIGLFTTSQNYQKGIEGEKAVTNALNDLDDSYCLINDILAVGRGGNIDHVLIGNNGVFVIETKNYSGTVWCKYDDWRKKGRRRYYDIPSISRQAKRNSKYIVSLVSGRVKRWVDVIPICVFVNPDVELRLYKPTVPVLQLSKLAVFIARVTPRTRLSDSDIHTICECILANTQSRAIDIDE